jgi:hypothetical protein
MKKISQTWCLCAVILVSLILLSLPLLLGYFGFYSSAFDHQTRNVLLTVLLLLGLYPLPYGYQFLALKKKEKKNIYLSLMIVLESVYLFFAVLAFLYMGAYYETPFFFAAAYIGIISDAILFALLPFEVYFFQIKSSKEK